MNGREEGTRGKRNSEWKGRMDNKMEEQLVDKENGTMKERERKGEKVNGREEGTRG